MRMSAGAFSRGLHSTVRCPGRSVPDRGRLNEESARPISRARRTVRQGYFNACLMVLASDAAF